MNQYIQDQYIQDISLLQAGAMQSLAEDFSGLLRMDLVASQKSRWKSKGTINKLPAHYITAEMVIGKVIMG